MQPHNCVTGGTIARRTKCSVTVKRAAMLHCGSKVTVVDVETKIATAPRNGMTVVSREEGKPGKGQNT